jgi:hypothetical protein
VRLNEIYDQFKDKVQFFCVYIQEMHPEDGWQVIMNVQESIVFDQPTSDDERAEVAAVCMLKMDFKMPMLLDNMSNEVDLKYAALPERLYVLDKDGRITFKCGIGPYWFDVPGWGEAVEEQAAIEG